MRREIQRQGKGGLELIEEAIHLLRTAPLSALASYYLGTLPFLTGLLYFWADMSRSPFAERRLAEAALGMAGLFVWMKFWQALFSRHLNAALLGTTGPRLTLKRCGRILVSQAALQPTGLFVLPVALVLMLPFAWTYAFYQNLTTLADGELAELRILSRKALQQAILWPRQNHLVLLVLGGFGLFVYLNWGTICLLLPNVVKSLLGMETAYSRSGLGMLNTTLVTTLLGLTYACVDPLLKACYTLRCFYGESLRTGEDLRVELRRFASARSPLAGALAVLMLAGVAQTANPRNGALLAVADADRDGISVEANSGAGAAAVPAAGPTAAAGSVSARELDRAIREVSQERRYAWRMPRVRPVEPEPERGVIGRFLQRVGELLRQWSKRAADWLGNWLDKLFRSQRQPVRSGTGYGWIFAKEILLYGLVIVAAGGLGYLIYYLWRGQRRQTTAVASEPIQLTPDLGDENVGPDQMPEDAWTRLAREMVSRGDLRLALRAFLLASLAHLATRNLVHLAKYKSNRDYERELQRRGHAFPDLLTVFGENVSVFDRAWYGLHELDLVAVDRFAANVDRIRGGG
jgi:hypothetical protein